MSYRVFARKYRPQTFDEVVGQEHITRTLQNGISNGRVAQAYLFVGPRGIGKTSTARILAKALNCVNGPTPTPCGVCDACQEIADGRSLDVLEIDGASNNGVENIRELRDNAAYAPARGPYKIYLIDEVHMLSAGAFNALLKTLEEPPEHVKFIFATTEAQKVPATITSRCQRFDLRRIPTEAIAAHLLEIARKEEITMEPEASDAIARGAEGGLRDAESMLDQAVAFCGQNITAADVMSVFGFTPRETIQSLMEHILARDAASTLAVVAEQASAGRDLSRLLEDLMGYVRDQLVAGVASKSGAAPREKLLMLLDHFAETEGRMRWASDKKLQFDVAVIKAVHLLDQVSLDDVIQTLSALGQGVTPPVLKAPPAAAAPSTPAPRPAAPAPIPVAPASAPIAAPITITPPASTVVPPPVAPAAAPIRVPEPPRFIAPPEPDSAPKVEAVPEAEPAPVAPSAPASPYAVPPVSEEGSIDGSVAWEQVKATYQSSIKWRFLTAGVFAEMMSDSTMVVHLPPSLAGESSSMLGEMGRKDAETKLSQELGRRITLRLEISDGVVEMAPAHTEEEPPAPAPAPVPAKAAPATPAPAPVEEKPPVDFAADFQNDPLIKKALEIFRSEIQIGTK